MVHVKKTLINKKKTMTTYLRYVPDGTVLKEHELLSIWNRYNANPPNVYSSTTIVSQARTLPGEVLRTDGYKDDLLLWEQVPAQRLGWRDSIYGSCPR